MQCAERGRDGERAVADPVDGMALRAMDAHEGQAALRRRRLGENGTANERKAPSATTSSGARPGDLRTI
jgi:hypothetical protein